MTASSPLAPAHLRRALLAALALLVLGVGVAPAHAVASSDPAEASEADTITTVLYPGWNMVGWVGPSTPTSELFDAIPALRQVSAWDADEQAYQHALRRRYDDLATLTLGMGLWLRLGGDSTIEWTRLVSGEGVVISSAPGGTSWAGRARTARLSRMPSPVSATSSWRRRGGRPRRNGTCTTVQARTGPGSRRSLAGRRYGSNWHRTRGGGNEVRRGQRSSSPTTSRLSSATRSGRCSRAPPTWSRCASAYTPPTTRSTSVTSTPLARPEVALLIYRSPAAGPPYPMSIFTSCSRNWQAEQVEVGRIG